MTIKVRPLEPLEFKRALAGVRPIPIEQSEHWQRLDDASPDRRHWGRLVAEEDGKPVAYVSFAAFENKGLRYLWARSGPIWVKEQSPQREAGVRQALVDYVRRIDPKVVFLRLHARYRAEDLHEPLQIITYDRTVIIPLAPRSEEEILATMPKDGQRSIRRALKRTEGLGVEFREDTGLTRQEFAEFYAVLQETAQRDGFNSHPAEYYWRMLSAIGPDNARLFSLRLDGQVVCWDLVLVNDKQAVAFFGASSAQGRKNMCPDALDWLVCRQLAAEGVESFDLMGIDSPRVPELYSVGRYKRKFTHVPADVDGAWDVAVRPRLYAGLKGALAVRRGVKQALRRR